MLAAPQLRWSMSIEPFAGNDGRVEYSVYLSLSNEVTARGYVNFGMIDQLL